MKPPGIWISPDAHFLVVLDKVTSVAPGGAKDLIIVRSGAGTVALDKANAEDFVAALIRFHLHGFSPVKRPTRR